MNRFEEYCYIIIRNSIKKYTNFIKIFDSKIEMPIEINEPVDIKYFTIDLTYNFNLITNKDYIIVFNSLFKNKEVIVKYDSIKLMKLIKIG